MNRRSFLVLLAFAASCDPQKADWGFDPIDGMKTPPDDPARTCGASVPADASSPRRAACAFASGTHASESLGIDRSVLASLPIEHVIVAMKENRSFDHLLGKLHDRGQPGVEAVPSTYSNPDARGNAVFPAHATTTCLQLDPGHQSEGILRGMNGGKMDGFVQNAAATTASDGAFVMSYYDATDLPFDYWLASTFAVSDRHFAPMPSGTYANRDFLLFGTNDGVVDTGIVYPPPNTPSILQLLMARGRTWRAYSDGAILSGTLDWSAGDPGVRGMQSFYDDLDHGTLPSVAFVDAVDYVEDDHPEADLQRGETWLKSVYDHALKSPQWQRLAIVWTYDEAGGFADHVAPPTACRPLPSKSPFTQLGPRIPFVVISPWAKRNYVSHVVHDHTAITRFIEALFDLPALTERDANSDALLDLFDFSCGRDLSVPPAPSPGTGRCP